MEDIVRNFLEVNKIDLRDQYVCIGVSGGVDSVVLLHILEQLQKDINFKIVVCHVNHKVRKESEEEETYIKNYCQGKHILEILHLSKNDKNESNFENVARNKRLNFFKDCANNYASQYCFLAHHLNDDIETSIMRILRGANLENCAGIQDLVKSDDVTFVRPLLTVLKRDIYKYAEDCHIKYFEDNTNATMAYARNRVRQQIVPVLFTENPNFGKNFMSFKEKVLYASSLEKEYRDYVIDCIVKRRETECEFKKTVFNGLANQMQKDVLFHLLEKYSFSEDNIVEIIKIINSNSKNIIKIYKGITVVKEYDDVTLLYYAYKTEPLSILITDYGTYLINDKLMLKVYKKPENMIITLPNIDIICYNSDSFPFCVRSRKNGDRMDVGNGTKKIKDILIDEKIPIRKRNDCLLLTNKNNEVLCVLGVKKAATLKINKSNDTIIELIRR